jgi:prepilin-type N-terminal cleavage/methylation domain-containing protein
MGGALGSRSGAGNGHAFRRGARGGFTLAEVMISVAVLVVAVLGTFATQLSSSNVMRTSRETNAAMMDLRSAMDFLLVADFDDLAAAGTDFADGAQIAAFTDLHLANEAITVDYPNFAGGAVPDPLQVVVTVTWTDFGGRDRSLSLSSMRTE